MNNTNPQPVMLTAHKAQLDFMNERSVPYVGYVGGRGSGKSYALAMRLYKWSIKEPGPYGMYSSSFLLLSDTIQKTFLEVAGHHIREFNQSKNIIRMVGGSEIMCRSLDDPERARGPSIRGAVWDETSLSDKKAFDILIGCLRWKGEQGWLGCGFTPKGLANWTADVFNDKDRPDAKCFHSTTRDNPFLPENFAATLRKQYTNAFAQQEIEGKFVNIVGSLMKREWFKIVTEVPPLSSCMRYWDMAATLVEGSNDPDWTAGAKVGRTKDGRWIILDMRHDRLSPAGNEMLVGHTASEDGRGVRIGMEEEGGASGKSLVDHYRRSILMGYHFNGHRPTGDKVIRAMPLAAAAEAGNVLILQGSWNKAWLDEVEAFGPDCPHDDQVDAVSGAVNLLAPRFIKPSVGFGVSQQEVLYGLEQQIMDGMNELATDAERAEMKELLI